MPHDGYFSSHFSLNNVIKAYKKDNNKRISLKTPGLKNLELSDLNWLYDLNLTSLYDTVYNYMTTYYFLPQDSVSFFTQKHDQQSKMEIILDTLISKHFT